MKLPQKTKFFILIGVVSVMTFGLFQNATLTPPPDMGIQPSPEQTANCMPPGSTVLGRYQTPIFTKISRKQNISYAPTVYNPDGKDAHLLDLYSNPNDVKDEARALIVWVHGGGFIGGDKDNYGAHLVALAKRGFIVASINYRTFAEGEVIPEGKSPVWKAEEDLKTALRYLYDNAAEHYIDRNKIFIAGSSAGAITTLTTALRGDSEIQIAGAMGVSGGIFDFDFDNGLIDQNDTIPLLMIHHQDDPTNDLNYTVAVESLQERLGSRPIYKKLGKFGIKATLYIDKSPAINGNLVNTHVYYALTPSSIQQGGELDKTLERESKFFYPIICGQ